MAKCLLHTEMTLVRFQVELLPPRWCTWRGELYWQSLQVAVPQVRKEARNHLESAVCSFNCKKMIEQNGGNKVSRFEWMVSAELRAFVGTIRNVLVAQLVELLHDMQNVGGSSPSEYTKFQHQYSIVRILHQALPTFLYSPE